MSPGGGSNQQGSPCGQPQLGSAPSSTTEGRGSYSGGGGTFEDTSPHFISQMQNTGGPCDREQVRSQSSNSSHNNEPPPLGDPVCATVVPKKTRNGVAL
uniref:Uncharacterized protein n=1 Tax=Knipowitschia caucasica TaxID=637954 RepID=A0AAV2K2A1_KNICA